MQRFRRLVRVRGASPTGGYRASLRDPRHRLPWGGETPPHAPPPRRSAPRMDRTRVSPPHTPWKSTPHDFRNGTCGEYRDLCACGALSPRGDRANRSPIRAIVFREEGKPLATPLPRGAARREWIAPEFRHRLLDPEPRPRAVSPSGGPLAPYASRNQRAGPARPPPPARLRASQLRSPPAGAAAHLPC